MIKTPEVRQQTSQKKTQKMSWLLNPQTTRKKLCGLGLLILAVFLPTWIITNCVYHPEDLGPFRPVCFEENYSTNESKLPMTHTVAYNTMNKSHQMQKRDVKIHDTLEVLGRDSRVTEEGFIGWVKSDFPHTQGNFICLPNNLCVVINATVSLDRIVLQTGI